MSRFKRDMVITTVISIAAMVAWRVGVVQPHKQRYADFYKLVKIIIIIYYIYARPNIIWSFVIIYSFVHFKQDVRCHGRFRKNEKSRSFSVSVC